MAYVPTTTEVPPPPPPRRRAWPVVLAVVVLLLAAGGAGAFLYLRGSDEVLFDQVPADADVVVAAYLDPGASQKVNLFRMTEKFPDLGSQQEITDSLWEQIDAALGESGLSREDLDWIGVEMAAWVDVRSGEEAEGALLIDSDDDEGARRAIDAFVDSLRDQGNDVSSSTYRGVELWEDASGGALALADSTVIIGSSGSAVTATIDVGSGEVDALDTSARFTNTLADLPSARLGLVYVDVEGISGALQDLVAQAGAADTAADLGGTQAVAMTLSATDTGLAIDSVQVNDPSQMAPEMAAALDEPPRENAAVAAVPADAYGIMALQHVDSIVEAGLREIEAQEPSTGDQLDELGVTGPGGLVELLSGDLAMEAGPDGTGPLGGAVLLGVDDAAGAQAWIDDSLRELERAWEGSVPPWTTQEHRGVSMHSIDDEAFPLTYAVLDDVLVVGSSPEHVADVIDVAQDGGGLATTDGFTNATEEGAASDALFFLDVPAVMSAVREQLPPEEVASFDEEIGTNLDPIGHVVMQMDGDAARQRLRLFVEIP